jgi:CcmD family protein
MTPPRFATVCLAMIVAAGLVTMSAAPARAQAQPPAGAQGDFVPAKDLPQQETIPAAPLVMGAYAFVWAALLVYVWTVWRRLLKVEKEVHDLAVRLATKPGRS